MVSKSTSVVDLVASSEWQNGSSSDILYVPRLGVLKSCYLVSKSTLLSDESDTCNSPLLALSTFLLEQSPTLYGHSHPHDPTIQILYHIVKESIEVEGETEQGFVDIVDIICSNNERLLLRIS
ncbi:hypothetical protein INT47_003146 [Mucor saturninus]|uniref:Uncharacterized protein n=1 Tax=Mucor saturninus TaxID=64648 RepID=A0A8H7R0G0_9FUNG|nr:hypothetical protein INT47_003146 [Mucor saturninus]